MIIPAGHVLLAVSVGQGDIEHSTVLHVPSARRWSVVTFVDNGVHIVTAETHEESREAWIASLVAVAVGAVLLVCGMRARTIGRVR